VSDERYQKGLRYLLKTQEADGSWKVEARARPIQVYFESGFPHKKGQFVSIAASSWAITAMLYAFPETEVAGK
jgi:N-acyl-D-amino-acid deacylase